jgi:hypothetical protein
VLTCRAAANSDGETPQRAAWQRSWSMAASDDGIDRT